MNVTGTSADLKRAMSNGAQLQNGMLTVTQPAMRAPTVLYTIKMEGITLSSCVEAIGYNSAMNSTAIITAARMGWTYFQQNGSGRLAVSRKFGLDNESGKEWTNF